jgi:hypothetical protein
MAKDLLVRKFCSTLVYLLLYVLTITYYYSYSSPLARRTGYGTLLMYVAENIFCGHY